MENNTEKFDKLFRDKFENLEIPYEQAHWEELESKLDNVPQPVNAGMSAGKIAIISGVVVLALASLYTISQDANEETSEKQDIQQTENVITSEEINPSEVEVSLNNEKKDEATQIPTQDGVTSTKEEVEPEIRTPEKSIEDEISHISAHNATQNKIKSDDYIQSNTDDIPKDASIANFDNAKLKTQFTADKTKICVGNEVQFNTEKDISGASYYWNFGDGGITSRDQNPKRKFMRPGTFTVTLIVSKGEKNDYITKMEQYIEVEKAPEFKIEWDDSELTSYDPYTEFRAVTTDPNAAYSWKIENKEYAGTNVEHIFETEGNFLAELTVNTGKCEVTKLEEIEILRTSKLPIEKAFTVNNDGLNDVFPAILSSITVPFKLKILDNAGRQLYYTESNGHPWNGKINNTGEVVPEGTYKCIIITTDKYNKEHLQRSVVKVLR